MNTYHEIVPIERGDAERALASGDSSRISDALLRSAYHDRDWRWVQAQCLWLLEHDDPNVRALAATCIGHLARIHGSVDRDVVIPALERVAADPALTARVEDALSDIEIFVRQ